MAGRIFFKRGDAVALAIAINAFGAQGANAALVIAAAYIIEGAVRRLVCQIYRYYFWTASRGGHSVINKESVMKNVKIAVPTNNPGGMAATRSDHFGHCDLFTLIDLQDGRIAGVETFANAEHAAGGCLVPVKLLKERNVDALVVGGIGMRPLQGFNEVGIDVYFAPREDYQDVQTVIEGFLGNKLPVMQPQQACKGGQNCHH